MLNSFDDIVFCIVLVFPIALFYYLGKKNWNDKDLNQAFWFGILAGVGAIILVKLIYVPIELYLGGDLRAFLTSPKKWYVILVACIGLVGFVEEGIKAMASHIVCCCNRESGFRPTYVFMSFSGCALSFAFIENLQYYFVYGSSVVLPRLLISSIAHLAFACISSYFSSIAFNLKKAHFKIAFYLNFGIILASVSHGFFDFILFKFSALSLSGLIIAVISILLYLIYQIWISALKQDIPQIGLLSVCSNCRALTVERIRFCPFCGNRVKRIDSYSSVVKDLN